MVWNDPEGTRRWLEVAEGLVEEGRGEELLPREVRDSLVPSWRRGIMVNIEHVR